MVKRRSQLFELYLFVRVIVASLVVGSTAVAQIIAQEVLNINPLNALVIYMLGYTLISAFVYLTLGYHPALLYAQYVADLSAITVLVYLTGSYSSPLTVFYLLFIIALAYTMSRNALLRLASLAVIFYGLEVIGVLFGFIPPYPSEWFPSSAEDFRPALFSMIYNLAALIATTLLISIPVDRVRKTQAAVQLEKRKVLNLQNILQFLVTNMPSPFFLTDTRGRMLFANAQGRRLLNLSASDDDPDLNLVERLRLPIRSDELARRNHWNFILQPDEDRSYDARLYAVPYPGEDAQWIWILQDVTEDLKRQEQLRMKDKMASLGEMAAGLAHEIKNPLAAIHTSVQLLQRRNPGEIHNVLPIIERETRRLRDVVDQFLKFARPYQLQIASVRLRTLVEDLESLLKMLPDFTPGHRLICQITPEDLTLSADPGGLRQVLWNLITNALKVMPEGGTVTLDATLDGDWVRFRVSDEGPGVPPDRLANLFVPFQKSTTGGLGLGLAIVYNIVQQHGGYIHARNRSQGGAVFEFWLPAGSS